MSGLEVVGSIASVLQLAATVYSISKTLYEVGNALSNAPSDIKDLARDLETFSEELHLLSSLLSDKTHRYSDRVYRLTAKIIGDCASICVKIDRILRKLRSGSFLARVKWVFKEKEIMKLLARLRDLKLSLMGTLSLLSALKADHMMDAMGVGNPSLLEGQKDERLSKETAHEMEETRKKLAGISADQNPDTPLSAMFSGTTLVSWVSQTSADTQHSLSSSEENAELPHASPVFSSSTNSLTGTTTSHVSAVSREIGQSNASIFISTIAVPPSNSLMQFPQAMASVQSFYSALSRYENEDLEVANTRSRNVINSNITPSPHVNSPKGLVQSSVEEWKADIINSAMMRFGMTEEDARSWVSALPVPSIPGSDVLDPPAIPMPFPRSASITAIEGGAAIGSHPGQGTFPYFESERTMKTSGGALGFGGDTTTKDTTSSSLDVQRHSTLRPLPSAPVDKTRDDDDWGLGIGSHVPTASTLNANNYETTNDYDEDDSEIEATTGFEAMRMAGEQDAYSRGGMVFCTFGGIQLLDRQAQDESSNSDSKYKCMDLGLVGGGYDAYMSYGDALAGMKAGHSSTMDGQSRPILIPYDLRTSHSYGEERAIPRETSREREKVPGQAAEGVKSWRPMKNRSPGGVEKRTVRPLSQVILRGLAPGDKEALDSVASSADEEEDSLPLVSEGNYEPGISTRTLRRKGGETRLGTAILPGQWISDGEYSDGSDYDIKRRLTKGPDEQSPSPRRYSRNKPLGGAPRVNTAAPLPIEVRETKETASIDTVAEAKHKTNLDNAKRAEISSGLTKSAHSTKKTHLQTPSQFYATAQHPSLASGNLNSVPEDEDGYVAASEVKRGKKGRITAGLADLSIANASLGSIGDEERSKPPAATSSSILTSNLSLTLGRDSRALTPASDDYMRPPPQVHRRRGKPVALNLAPLNTKPVRPSQSSKALQSLKSARSPTALISSVYPPNTIAPTGKGLRYDIEFLLQFQKVCTWMPSMYFESQTKALFRDGDRGRFGSILARNRRGTNVDTVEIRGRTAVGGAALGTIGAEVITRAKTRDREFEKERSRSSPRSESPHSYAKFKTGLQLAAAGLDAAAAVKYAGNHKGTAETVGRGRSRTRSASSWRRSYSSYSSDEDRHSGSRYATVHRYRVGSGKVAEQAEVDKERNSIRGPERERERTRAVVFEREHDRERDRDHFPKGESARPWEQRRDRNWEVERYDRESDTRFAKSPQEREANYELERYSRDTDYYNRHEPPRQPIVIRQEALGPKQILSGQLNESAKRTREEDKYYFRRDVGDFKHIVERSWSATRAGTEVEGIGLGNAAIAGLYENRKPKDKGKRGDSTAEEKPSPLPSHVSSITKERDFRNLMKVDPDFEIMSTNPSRRHLEDRRSRIDRPTGRSRMSSLSLQGRMPIEDSLGNVPFGIHRSLSVGADDREPTSLQEVLELPMTTSPPPLRLLQPVSCIAESSTGIFRQHSSLVERNESEDLQIPEALDTNLPHRPRLGHIRGTDTMLLTGSSSLSLARPSGSTISQKALGKIQDLEAEPLLLDMSEIGSDDNQKSTDGPRPGYSGSHTPREPSSFESFRLDPQRNWSSSISERHNDLWIGAFAQLRTHDSESSQNIWVALAAAHSYLTSRATSEDSVARMTATRLGSVMNMTRTQLLESPTELSRSTASCIDNFSKILNVLQETLNFKTGAFVWTCLCAAEKEILEDLSTTQILSNSHALADLSEIATLVARYNVLESMYQQWPGMSLEKMYEKSLVGLCINVLKYLDLVLSHPPALKRKDFEQRREAHMANIRSADIACRGFSVTIVNDDESVGRENKVEDVSTDEEDSDTTERGEDTCV